MKKATVIGGGLVGALWSLYLTKFGYRVDVFERRPDLQLANTPERTSINLAISYRGWKALEEVDLANPIRKVSIPMYGRCIHHKNEETSYQLYDQGENAIYSVSRKAINAQLIAAVRACSDVDFHFNEEFIHGDTSGGISVFKNSLTGKVTTHSSPVTFATDGAFSTVRQRCFLPTAGFNYQQRYIEHGYREILLPAGPNGTFLLDKNYLHIWPRERFMLVALPNFDGSFTCTLFMPMQGKGASFEQINTSQKATAFFQEMFPDFYQLLPNATQNWSQIQATSLAIISCYPWHFNQTLLMGDAAHATVPFYGQGMNCGFEDCRVLANLAENMGDNWPQIMSRFEKIRRPNTDAMQTLSLNNYRVMRSLVTNPAYVLEQRVEQCISELYPEHYFAQYKMVSFTDIPYRDALRIGNRQNTLIKIMIERYNIQLNTSPEEIAILIEKHFKHLEHLKTDEAVELA